MDLTQGTLEEKNNRAKKMMLWFGIISLSMMFAGLTSAYIVSKERKDWITDFNLPQAFYISTAIIILSSITMHMAKKAIKNDKQRLSKIGLVATFILGLGFIFLQFLGFDQIINEYYCIY